MADPEGFFEEATDQGADYLDSLIPPLNETYDTPPSAADVGSLIIGKETGTDSSGSSIDVEDKSTDPEVVTVHTGSGPFET